MTGYPHQYLDVMYACSRGWWRVDRPILIYLLFTVDCRVGFHKAWADDSREMRWCLNGYTMKDCNAPCWFVLYVLYVLYGIIIQWIISGCAMQMCNQPHPSSRDRSSSYNVLMSIILYYTILYYTIQCEIWEHVPYAWSRALAAVS